MYAFDVGMESQIHAADDDWKRSIIIQPQITPPLDLLTVYPPTDATTGQPDLTADYVGHDLGAQTWQFDVTYMLKDAWNTAALAGQIEVYDLRTMSRVTQLPLPADKRVATSAGTKHTVRVNVPGQPNPPPREGVATAYVFVVSADDNHTDREKEHRIKPALENGQSWGGVVDLDWERVPDDKEATPGEFLGVNDDDDNGDGRADKDEGVPPAGEDDLVKMILQPLGVATAPTEPVTFVAFYDAYPPEGRIRLWQKNAQGNWVAFPSTPWDRDSPGDREVEEDLQVRDLPKEVWVEGLAPSVQVEKVGFKLKYSWNGPVYSDTIYGTVLQVTSVTPNQATPVLISTKHDDNYPSTIQTEDRKLPITALMSPAVAGMKIHFRSIDPDDESSYETDTAGGDNHDPGLPRGQLEAAPGYTGSGSGEEIWVETDANGRAVATLTITAQYAGDNYRVRSRFGETPDALAQSAGPLIAWKRVYVEEDQMYKKGSDLAQDFIPDPDGNPDQIRVVDASGFAVGNNIEVFDTVNRELRVILVRNGNILTVGDLQYSYNAGYGPGDRGAAVARPNDGTWQADLSLYDEAFGAVGPTIPDPRGATNGACFVQFISLAAGAGKVPFRETLTANQCREFSNMWFANQGKSNYFHVVGAKYGTSNSGDPLIGLAWSDINVSYTFVRAVHDAGQFPNDTTVHELGHQFDLNQVDTLHPNVLNHEGTDRCVMDQASNGADNIAEMCYNAPTAPNHLHQVRDATDDR